MERHLAALLAADVAGYSRLTGADEEDTNGKDADGRNKSGHAELVRTRASTSCRRLKRGWPGHYAQRQRFAPSARP